ncbi:DegT/DnrJ/EryC1/StrS family aminotransferase [Bradyrhizobium sp. SZCCHNR1070]|uniref:DegT/DnrJ/EryC1/StrS family aminotransferase n=1 Tax=Bradyrhizobium sp. SZCCHNR1070 TaxID=3057361 RepID=UPI002916E0A3|nr:DegT/DnrJ/EryC1/StrS family aminotransferase [Bradyrhizobium sp. SZCCHNR1070]
MSKLDLADAPERKIPFNDLSIQWRQIAASVRDDFETTFDQSAFCLGPFVERFETEISQFLGARHAIGVNSGTSALHLAVLAAGLGPGDEVIVPAHSFIATLWGVLYAGATPVFCDVEAETGTLDVRAAERCITPATKAIIPVHLYGQPADMAAVKALAKRHGLTIIEDAAQAIDARWEGQHVGTIGAMGCFSFYPGKNLGAAGEAGLVVTNDDDLAAKMRSLRNHGQSERYIHQAVGYNYRMDGLQGVVLRRKLPLLGAWTASRRELAMRYSERLAGTPLQLPAVRYGEHVWHLYVVRTPDRDRLRAALAERGIETGLHYPVPLHKQPCLANLPSAGQGFPSAEAWASQCLSLPLFTGMTFDDVDYVADTVRASY